MADLTRDQRDALEAELQKVLLPILQKHGVNLEVTVIPTPPAAPNVIAFRR
jgi:hypothetical protein